MTPAYAVEVAPARALLGEAIVAVLACTAKDETAGVLTFAHGSLTLQLSPVPPAGEPVVAFPNRYVLHEGELLIRGSRPGGVEDLRAGERRERSFELDSLFPVAVLDVGRFELSYTLQQGDHRAGAGPTQFQVESGPAAVALLIGRLEDTDAGVRTRAAGLLHRMTAAGLDFDPAEEAAQREEPVRAFRDWWEATRSHRAWDFHSDGASFGRAVPPPPREGRSGRLGGVAYPVEPLDRSGRQAVLAALRRFLTRQSPGALRGEIRVADREARYPPEGVFLPADPELEKELSSVMERLAALAAQRPDLGPAALMAVRTAARMPSPGLADALTRFASAAPSVAEWRKARTIAQSLLDLLDHRRVPVSSDGHRR